MKIANRKAQSQPLRKIQKFCKIFIENKHLRGQTQSRTDLRSAGKKGYLVWGSLTQPSKTGHTHTKKLSTNDEINDERN